MDRRHHPGIFCATARLGATAVSASLLLGLALSPGCTTDRAPILAAEMTARENPPRPPRGVCPPFKLRDEQGRVIDPVAGINADQPYSPKQTCGQSGCHDYRKITQGYHFTQGKGEAVPQEHRERYAWVTSPGQYGGRW